MVQLRSRQDFLLPPSPLHWRRRHPPQPDASVRWLMLGITIGGATAALLLPIPRRLRWELLAFYDICRQKREPTSGLKTRLPLLQLRVMNRTLLGFARACKSSISKRVSFLQFAACCTVLRSRWCQSGVNRGRAGSRSVLASVYDMISHLS